MAGNLKLVRQPIIATDQILSLFSLFEKKTSQQPLLAENRSENLDEDIFFKKCLTIL